MNAFLLFFGRKFNFGVNWGPSNREIDYKSFRTAILVHTLSEMLRELP